MALDSTSQFRFRDQGMGYSTQTDSDQFSSHSDSDDNDFELDSMTGKGIRRLCSELLDLKKASHDDLQKSVYENYSTFLRIVEEVKGLENELSDLGRHISTQRTLVEDLTDSTDLKIISDEIAKSIDENLLDISMMEEEESQYSSLVSETFDILLLENRPDKALYILEVEMESTTTEKAESDHILDQATLLELQNKLTVHYAMAAGQPRINISEFQHALTGLYRLGETQRAHSLLMQHYHSRLVERVSEVKNLKPFANGIYAIKELASAIYSTISQAARSVIMLEGGACTYSSEFYEWVQEAIEEFVVSFDMYIKSIAEPSLGLVVAVDAIQHVKILCTALESQGLLLQAHFIKLAQPCIELFYTCIEHFKRAISVFVSNDNWVLGEFPISRSLSRLVYNVGIKDMTEFFLLTSSGWKVIQHMQTIMEDVSPLLFLPVQSTILEGFADVFMEYVAILEECITVERTAIEQDAATLNLATKMPQRLSVLINLSTLVIHLLPCIAKQTLDHGGQSERTQTKEHNRSSHLKMLENWISSIQEAESHLRHHFCKQFVEAIMLPKENEMGSVAETYFDSLRESAASNYALPSLHLQVLFLRLGQLKKLGDELAVGSCWKVEELLMEVMETVIEWIADNHEQWNLARTASSAQQSTSFLQIVLDIQFLLEIARIGGYASESIVNALSDLMDQLETQFLEAGWDLSNSTAAAEKWAPEAAKAAIAKLQGRHEIEDLSASVHVGTSQETSDRKVADEEVNSGSLDVEADGKEDYDGDIGSPSMPSYADSKDENDLDECSSESEPKLAST